MDFQEKDRNDKKIKLPEEVYGIKITEKHLSDIKNFGSTELIKGFEDPNSPGRKFNAFLTYDEKKEKVKLDFDTNVRIHQKILGAKISDKDKLALQERRETGLIKGFVDPETQKEFNGHVRLVYDQENQKYKYLFREVQLVKKISSTEEIKAEKKEAKEEKIGKGKKI